MRMGIIFEHKKEPLLPRNRFLFRMLAFAGASLATMLFSLAFGMLGYRHFAGFGWVDAFLNAAMIMGGMGPVDALQTDAAKIFAGCYALYCGLVLLVSVGIFLSPIIHRLFHRFHLEVGADND